MSVQSVSTVSYVPDKCTFIVSLDFHIDLNAASLHNSLLDSEIDLHVACTCTFDILVPYSLCLPSQCGLAPKDPSFAARTASFAAFKFFTNTTPLQLVRMTFHLSRQNAQHTGQQCHNSLPCTQLQVQMKVGVACMYAPRHDCLVQPQRQLARSHWIGLRETEELGRQHCL